MARGKQIKTLEQINTLALNRKSVTWGLNRRSPAAWVISMQARSVLLLINSGLYEYKKDPIAGERLSRGDLVKLVNGKVYKAKGERK